jgi:hypothetical protein
MLSPRPHADFDPCADREGILLNGAEVRPRTHTAFKPADGAFRGPHLPGDFLLCHARGSARCHKIGDEELQRAIARQCARTSIHAGSVG